MFDSVLRPRGTSGRRIGLVAVLSVAFHLGVVGIIVFVTSRPPPPREDFTELLLFPSMPQLTPPPPPLGVKQPVAAATVKPRTKKTFQQPRVVPREEPAEPAQAEPEAVAGEAGPVGDPQGSPDGVEGGVIGGTPGGMPGAETVLPFGEGMSRPQYDAEDIARAIPYSREAREAGVEGLLIVKCVVRDTGEVRNCRMIKPLPHFGTEVLRKLEGITVTPATYQGRPISIDYVFNFQLTMPR